MTFVAVAVLVFTALAVCPLSMNCCPGKVPAVGLIVASGEAVVFAVGVSFAFVVMVGTAV